MKRISMMPVILPLMILAVVVSSHGQHASTTRDEQPDKGFDRVEIHFDTRDRSFTALQIATQQTKVSETVTRQESVVQVPLANGSLAEAERTTTVTEQLGDGQSRTTSEKTETDRQGKSRITSQATEIVVSTADGQKLHRVETRRNSSGQMVRDREVNTVERKQADGTIVRQTEEQSFDVNNRAELVRQVDEVIVSKGKDETVVESTIRSREGISGRLRETARERTVTKTVGDRTETERVISTPRGVGWEVQSRVVSTEIKAADGGIERETIKYEQPGYAGGGGVAAPGKIKPRLKIVEKYVVGAGGRATVDRQVYVRDVNNRWVPQTFSSKIPGRGAYERRE